MKNPVDLVIVQRVLEVLILCVMVEVVIEVGIVNSVYVDTAIGPGKWFPEKGIMPLSVRSMGGIEVF